MAVALAVVFMILYHPVGYLAIISSIFIVLAAATAGVRGDRVRAMRIYFFNFHRFGGGGGGGGDGSGGGGGGCCCCCIAVSRRNALPGYGLSGGLGEVSGRSADGLKGGRGSRTELKNGAICFSTGW